MYQHIMIPLDGSPLAEAALPYALELARRFESKVTLIRILLPASQRFTQLGTAQDVQVMMELHKKEQEASRSYLKQMEGSLSQQGYKISSQVIEGIPIADHIIDEARALEVDTIVMSTHGRTGVGRLLFGSVAENVLRQADMPVLLVRSHLSDKPK